MAPATDTEPLRGASDCTPQCGEYPCAMGGMGSKQATTWLYIASEYMEKETTTIDDPVSEEDWNSWHDYVIL